MGPTRYVDHQSSIDNTVPHGWHYYWKAANLASLSDEVIDIVVEHAYDATSPRSYAAMFHLGGAVARAPREATAYTGRDVEHNIVIDAAWLPEQDGTVAAMETAWARSFLDALQHHRAGVYVNFLDSDDDSSRVREAYGDDSTGGSRKLKPSTTPTTCSTTTRTSSQGRVAVDDSFPLDSSEDALRRPCVVGPPVRIARWARGARIALWKWTT